MAAFDPEALRLSSRPLAVSEEPCGFFHVDDFLPASLYTSLQASFPREEVGYTADPDGKLGLRSSSAPAGFDAFCRAHPDWRALIDFLASDAFVLDLGALLRAPLVRARGLLGHKRWRNDSGRAASNNPLHYTLGEPVRTTFQFSRLSAGTEVTPHTDAPRKLVSLMLYFASPDWQPGWGGGTAFLRPGPGLGRTAPTERVDWERLSAGAEVGFVPNRLVGFVRSERSWHGVRPLACPPGRTRDALLINVKRVKWSKRDRP